MSLTPSKSDANDLLVWYVFSQLDSFWVKKSGFYKKFETVQKRTVAKLIQLFN